MYMYVQSFYFEKVVRKKIYEDKMKGVLIFIHEKDKDDKEIKELQDFLYNLETRIYKKENSGETIENKIWVIKDNGSDELFNEFNVLDPITAIFFDKGVIKNRLNSTGTNQEVIINNILK